MAYRNANALIKPCRSGKRALLSSHKLNYPKTCQRLHNIECNKQSNKQAVNQGVVHHQTTGGQH